MASERPIGTFCWAELGTSDAAGAIAFYAELFGWRAEARDMGEMGVYHMLSIGGDDLGGLYEMRGPMFEGVPSNWMHYIRVEDVDAIARRVPELGGAITMPPMDVPNGGRMVMFQDSSGARLAAFEAGSSCAETADPSVNHAWGWAELHTRELAGAKTFYSELFGWEAKDSPGYTEWTLPGQKQFAGLIEMDARWGEAPPCWMGYVMVEDCDVAFAKAQSLGARAYVPPQQIEDVGKFAVIADPQGASFAFITLDEKHAR